MSNKIKTTKDQIACIGLYEEGHLSLKELETAFNKTGLEVYDVFTIGESAEVHVQLRRGSTYRTVNASS